MLRLHYASASVFIMHLHVTVQVRFMSRCLQMALSAALVCNSVTRVCVTIVSSFPAAPWAKEEVSSTSKSHMSTDEEEFNELAALKWLEVELHHRVQSPPRQTFL